MKDPCIRKLLYSNELSHYLNDSDSKVVEELTLPVAKARIDIAVINGALHGYEIKSASDTLNRLPGQIQGYTKVFDYLSIVTEEKYVFKIESILPDWIGLILCDDKNGTSTISTYKEAKLNLEKESFYIAKLLWKEELIFLLEKYRLNFKKTHRTWILCENVAANLDIEILSEEVRQILKLRYNWKQLTTNQP